MTNIHAHTLQDIALVLENENLLAAVIPQKDLTRAASDSKNTLPHQLKQNPLTENHENQNLDPRKKISAKDTANISTIEITDITFDSRKVTPGALFICKGAAFKTEYLQAAIEAGAVAYLSEIEYDVEIPALIVTNTRKAMAIAARHFFDYPDQKLCLIGVTATKGKTTTVYMIKSIFDQALLAAAKKPCGLLSGIEIYDGENVRKAHLTTDESVELLRNLARCVEHGLTHCVVEISSQALKYDRVYGIEFDICTFTNIGNDHISPLEHPDFTDYLNSKLRITEHTKNLIYSASMEHCAQIKAKAAQENLKSYEILFSEANCQDDAVFLVHDISTDAAGSHFKLNNQPYTITMPGEFNIENAAAAIGSALIAGIKPKDIARGLSDVHVPGRSELISTSDNKLHCFVDYAHNALSFEKALLALRTLFPNAQIVSLFGAPGDKAYNRRKELPRVAAKYSDRICVLPEDTGKEDVVQIAREIAANIPQTIPHTIFTTRAEGIETAFRQSVLTVKENSQTEFVLFIAGKGEEDFMKVAGRYDPYIGDHQVVKKLIAEYDTQLKKSATIE